MSEPTIAVALGAGGARGLAHIHALEALDDMGIKPVAMSGTSIGSIMAAGYASGLSGRDIHEYARERFRNRFKLLADLWHTRPDTVRALLRERGDGATEINIERILTRFLPGGISETFEDLSFPVSIVATDYYGHCDRIFESGPILPAMAASAAIPAVFKPMVIDGRVLIDGGMTNPTPFDILAGKADIVVAVDVCGGPRGEPGKRPNKIDVMYASIQLMQLSITKAKAASNQLDVYLRPDVERFRVLDFLKTNAILDATAPFREEFKRTVDAAMRAHARMRYA
jgi:NTE family protein